MSRTPESLSIRQSDDGKWEVKDAFSNCHKCETKEDAEILSNVPADTILFKYRSMATPEATEHTLDIIKNQRLFCPAPDSFNDPFECQANISFAAPLEVKNKQATERLIKENPQMTEAEAKRLAPERWKQIEQGGIDRLRSLVYNKFAIVCFSKIKDDILMWAHYAGGHNGVCIEFCCTTEGHVNGFFEKAFRVTYEEKIPKVNFYTTGFIKISQASVMTKSKHWEYEQELRIIETNVRCKPHYISVPTGAMTAVYLGCEITKDNRDAVLDCVKNNLQNKISLFEAKRKPDVYGLNFEPISI